MAPTKVPVIHINGSVGHVRALLESAPSASAFMVMFSSHLDQESQRS
jgi:hypothetical protein